jgi:hypothetical protein
MNQTTSDSIIKSTRQPLQCWYNIYLIILMHQQINKLNNITNCVASVHENRQNVRLERNTHLNKTQIVRNKTGSTTIIILQLFTQICANNLNNSVIEGKQQMLLEVLGLPMSYFLYITSLIVNTV